MHTKATSSNKWKIQTIHRDYIPVATEDPDILKYVDEKYDDEDEASAGALLFASWKIPDGLSTFDEFWEGKLYIGNIIDNPPDDMNLWIPIQVGEHGIFDGNDPFYKKSAALGSAWNGVQTAHNAELLDGIVKGQDAVPPDPMFLHWR